MKILLTSLTTVLVIVSTTVGSPAYAGEQTYQQGYTRKNGTYVGGHHKTTADDKKYNNYGSRQRSKRRK